MNFFQQEVDSAVDALLWQQVILYPTDAGWSIGCDAEAPRAVALLHKLKEKEMSESSLVLVADMAMLARYAAVSAEALAAVAVATAAQEGPVTYLLPAARAVTPALLGPDGTVGLRITQDEFCHRVLRRLGHGLVSTSASKAGKPTPATYAEIDSEIVRGADHVARWRRDDLTQMPPLRVLRLGASGVWEGLGCWAVGPCAAKPPLCGTRAIRPTFVGMNTPELPDLPIFRTIAEAASELGQSAYVVGGYVRDLVLNRPSKDIDVVTVGDGIRLAEAVGKKLKGRGKVQVFKNFGTAMLPTKEAGDIEFVGARKESYRADSRKPDVLPGTLAEDLARRDFTINALGLSLNPENFGELIDQFDGMSDLRSLTIRTPLGPDITFSDDPLRMMRAVRFASQLGFDIEPDTFDAIVRNKERIAIVSQERITVELNKIIESPLPSYGFKLLFQTGLLHLIFPKMVLLHGVEKVGKHAHKDNFYHTLQVLDNVAAAGGDLWLRWAAILHDIAKPATKRYFPNQGWTFHGHEDKGARWVPQIFTDLKLPLGEEMRMVQKLVKLHLRPIVLSKSIVTDSAVRRLLFEAGDDIDRLMLLCRADITSKDHEKKARYLQNFDLVEEKLREVESKDHLRNFKPVITGEIIMETFGLKPSKEVGKLKNAVLEAILEGEIRNDLDEAMAFLRRLAGLRGFSTREAGEGVAGVSPQ